MSLPTEVYNTSSGIWERLEGVSRFRHVAWIHNQVLCIVGGFESEASTVVLDRQISLDLSEYIEAKRPASKRKATSTSEESKSFSTKEEEKKAIAQQNGKAEDKKESKDIAENANIQKQQSSPKDSSRKLKLSPRVMVAISHSGDMYHGSRKVVRTLPMNCLQEEGKKLVSTNRVVFGPSPDDPSEPDRKRETIAQMFVNHLLRPKEWIINQMDRQFMFKKEDIILLANECIQIVKSQPTVLRVKVPVKIFGDFHGQYQDMMRFFDLWRGPIESLHGGDIESYDYLFLGDYVDRGANSLETICLLMALKVKFPTQIHLLRGNHEDISTNQAFGFAEECEERLDDDLRDEYSVFQTINRFFEWLPLAAVIEDRILCLHGGIGGTLNNIAELEAIQRPKEVMHDVKTKEDQLLIDVLWSDPTENDQNLGIFKNLARDPSETGFIVKYGPDRVEQFLQNNDLMLIVRGHECVMDGIERFAKGQLITLFSATDYCGKHKNAGGALFVQKDYEIVPKLIFPLNNGWIDNDRRPQTPPSWEDNPNDRSFT
eukprot:TRINITY_DN7045_c0_g1_i14.p1 TRINITY_DN7045_c0_g1~~TRINITY_DN7045_c0_g1_i14.p1  ORF type:complete len:544 (+),score=157.61 TRINITY_DN7045_c0_g1_i14:939-2570(+)